MPSQLKDSPEWYFFSGTFSGGKVPEIEPQRTFYNIGREICPYTDLANRI